MPGITSIHASFTAKSSFELKTAQEPQNAIQAIDITNQQRNSTTKGYTHGPTDIQI